MSEHNPQDDKNKNTVNNDKENIPKKADTGTTVIKETENTQTKKILKNDDKNTANVEKNTDIKDKNKISNDKNRVVKPIEGNKNSPNKKAEISKKPSPKPKESPKPAKRNPLFGFLWPLLCSAAVGGALIFTQNTWLNHSNITDGATPNDNTQQVNAQAIAQLTKQMNELDNIKVQAQSISDQKTDSEAALTPLRSQLQELQQNLDNRIAAIDENLNNLQANYARINTQTDNTLGQIQALSDQMGQNTTPEIQQDINALEATRKQALSALENQVSELTTNINNVKDQQPLLDKLDNRMNETEGQIQQLQTQIDTIATNATQYSLPNTALITLSDLDRKIGLGQDYSKSLEALPSELLSAKPQDIATLQKHAKGVTSLYALQAGFNDVSRDIIIAEREEKAKDQGQRQNILTKLNELVTISRSNGGAEGSADRLIYNIKQALKLGDLSTASQQLQTASPQAQEKAQLWYTQLNNRLEAIQALDNIHEYVVNMQVGE